MTKLDDLRLLHDQMKSLHMMYYDLLSGMSGAIKKEYSPETLADIGFFCREGEILLDDWRKNAKAFKELISRKLSRTILQDPKNLDPETAYDMVHGEYASAQANVSVFAELPKQGTAEYDILLKFFNVQGDFIKLDWMALKREVTRRAEAGEQLPPGLGKQFPEYTAIYRRKNQCRELAAKT